MTLVPIDKKKLFRLITIELIVAGSIFFLSVILFTFLANEVVIEKEDEFDISTYNLMASWISPVHTKLASFVTFFGSQYFLVPVYILIIVYFIEKNNYRYGILVSAVALTSLFSGMIFKEIFHRPRPFLPLITGTGVSHSFPSGHSLAGFTFSGLLAYLFWSSNFSRYKKWILTLFMLIFGALIGLSRIYLRVHFASDVLGSLLLTTTWLSLTFISMRIIEKRFTNQISN